MKISPRSQKLAGAVRTALPEILHRILPPEKVGLLTVSAVEVSGDLQVADVFLRSIGGKNDFLKLCEKVAPKIQFALSAKVKTRLPIQLRFKKDASINAAKIFEKK